MDIAINENYGTLESNEICILTAKAPVIKDAISTLKEFHIDYFVNPKFLY